MPPRRAPSTDRQAENTEDRQGNTPPPPNGDAATCAREGMARFFEQQFQQAPRPQLDVYDQFRRLGPKEFFGTTDPFAAEGWIRSLEVRFRYLNVGDANREIFYEKYFTVDVRGRLKREFMGLRQGDTTVAEFVKKFDRCCHFVPLIARDAAEKLRHFMDGLRPITRRDVMMMRLTGYASATVYALQAEQVLKDINYEMQRKGQQH
ncbi:uncharacterized protein LOC142554613 [Primulina tabacum]|uniref:uncharacterized protein LOC142554613 n=1 Tax=Primulina tabacum TaxID=48773 RepID=UPI003F59C487